MSIHDEEYQNSKLFNDHITTLALMGCPITLLFRAKCEAPVLNVHWEFIQHDTIGQLNHILGHIHPETNYYNTLPHASEGSIQQIFLEVKKDQKYIGYLYFQLVDFQAGKAWQYKHKTEGSAWSRRYARLMQRLLSIFSWKILVAGNLIRPGFHAFGDQIVEEVPLALFQAIPLAFLQLSAKYKPAMCIIKECDAELQTRLPQELNHVFHPMEVDQGMFFYLRKHWKSMDDYILDLESKYRVRYRRAIKKFQPYAIREISVSEVNAFGAILYQLYTIVRNNADFNPVDIMPGYFEKMKQACGDQYKIFIAYHESKVVGFYSFFLNNHHIETNYIGYLPDENKEHQTYLVLLYHMIDQCIQLKKEYINMGRTAFEIKSSVGAVPMSLNNPVQLSNPFLQRIFPKVFRLMYKRTHWVQRKPFKSDSTGDDATGSTTEE